MCATPPRAVLTRVLVTVKGHRISVLSTDVTGRTSCSKITYRRLTGQSGRARLRAADTQGDHRPMLRWCRMSSCGVGAWRCGGVGHPQRGRNAAAPTLVNVLDAKIFDNTQSSFLSQALKFQPAVRRGR